MLAGDSLGPSSSGSNGIVKLYRPPFEEFEIQTVALPAGGTARLEANQGPLMVLVQQGSGTMACADDGPGGVAAALAGQGAPGLQLQAQVSRGAVLFVAAGVPLQLAAGAASQLLLYVAAVNGTFFQLHDALQDAAAAVAPATANGARLLPQQAVVGA